MIHLAVHDGLKAAESFLNRHVFSFHAREFLRHKHGLGEKSLGLSGSFYRQLVLVGKFLHTEDGDNILKLAVFL